MNVISLSPLTNPSEWSLSPSQCGGECASERPTGSSVSRSRNRGTARPPQPGLALWRGHKAMAVKDSRNIRTLTQQGSRTQERKYKGHMLKWLPFCTSPISPELNGSVSGVIATPQFQNCKDRSHIFKEPDETSRSCWSWMFSDRESSRTNADT